MNNEARDDREPKQHNNLPPLMLLTSRSFWLRFRLMKSTDASFRLNAVLDQKLMSDITVDNQAFNLSAEIAEA